MDYAFVPGIGDPDLEVLSGALKRRSNTTVVALTAKSVTLAKFLDVLHEGITTANIPQMDDLILGAHGSIGGFLFLSLDDQNPSPVDYDSFTNLTTIKIPAGVGTANSNVRLASCNLGSDESIEVLKVLKQALGNPKSVSAPRFIHSLYHPHGTDFWEAMAYNFLILGDKSGTEPFTDRDDVVKAFRNAGLKRFDGTPVPAASWDDWVPSSLFLNLDPTTKWEIELNFPVKLVFLGGVTSVLDASRKWISHHEKTTKVINSTVVPADPQAERDILKAELLKDVRYTPAHPYPVYKRYDHTSLDNYVNGWKWKVTPLPNNQLQYVGRRYVYQLQIPVTDPASGGWIYNLYPDSGSPTINFTESSQPKLFGIV